jgi:hypothetical protein
MAITINDGQVLMRLEDVKGRVEIRYKWLGVDRYVVYTGPGID